jgi:hypothetical protein
MGEISDLVVLDFTSEDLDRAVSLAERLGVEIYSYADSGELVTSLATPEEILYVGFELMVGRTTLEYFNLEGRQFIAIRYTGDPIETRQDYFKKFLSEYNLDFLELITDKHLEEQAFIFGLEGPLSISSFGLIADRIEDGSNYISEITLISK